MTVAKVELESVAKVLIVDNQNRALVLTLAKHLASPEKSYLPDLPGGVVDPGESEQAGAIREVYEECGITLDPDTTRLAYSNTSFYEKESKSVTKLLYIAHVDEPPRVTLSWEHSEYKWIAVDALHEVDLRQFFNEAIRYCSEHGLI